MPSLFIYKERQKASKVTEASNSLVDNKLPNDNGNNRKEPHMVINITNEVIIKISI
jgi:hypothetical protein